MLLSTGNQGSHRAHDWYKISKYKFVTHSQWESAQATLLKKSCSAKLLKKLPCEVSSAWYFIARILSLWQSRTMASFQGTKALWDFCYILSGIIFYYVYRKPMSDSIKICHCMFSSLFNWILCYFSYTICEEKPKNVDDHLSFVHFGSRQESVFKELNSRI